MAVQNIYDISVIKGDTYNGVQFTVEVNGSPKDLTGAVIKME